VLQNLPKEKWAALHEKQWPSSLNPTIGPLSP